MTSREKMRESLVVQEWLSEGRAEGAFQQARFALNLVARSRFPRIRIAAAVAKISDLSVLGGLLSEAATAPDAAALSQAVTRAQKT